MPEVARITIEAAGGTVVLLAEPRTFKTGSRDCDGPAKAQGTDGRRFQVSVDVAEIGSKPQPSAAEAEHR